MPLLDPRCDQKVQFDAPRLTSATHVFVVAVLFACSWLCAAAGAAASRSASESRPPDVEAVCLDSPDFHAAADGIADDTDALQAAINRVQERTTRGVVLIPSGRYRLTKTIHVWSGIRLIGFGPTRPVLVLGENAAGFGGPHPRYLVHFVSDRPREGEPIRDANPGTFYSAMSNIDVQIGAGNPAAVGVRFHVAQHGFLAHMDFEIGDGLAGVEEIGNELHNCRFIGGQYGVLTTKPSPSWPFVLMDSAFSGQRVAAIRTEEAGMTIVRCRFSRVPTAVSVNPGRVEELFIQDSLFESISGPAVVVSEENSARMQLNLLNVGCRDVPTLVRFRQSGREVTGPAKSFLVRNLSHGLQISALGAQPRIATTVDLTPVTELPELAGSDVPELPSVESWRSAKDFGAVGDGAADDTEALRKAIASSRVVFLPAGFYRVTDTLIARDRSEMR